MVFFCALLPALSFALQESTGPNGSNVQTVHALGFTGQDISVGLISQDHSLISHEAFAGHAFCYNATDPDNTTCLPSDHDTSVGGIICSRGGVLYPDDKGAAPDAELHTVKVAIGTQVNTAWIIDGLDYLAGLDPAHPIQKCQVVVTGIQLPSSGVTPDGTSIWTRIYDYYAYAHNMVFATAAGNYDTSVTVFGDSYNSITAGGLIGTATDLYDKVGTGSNYGPTADGRNKPDITAPSQNQWVPSVSGSSDTYWVNEGTTAGQTSWSVPHTGGVAAVLLDYANSSASAEPEDDQNEVIKAVIVNSTFPNIQDENGTATTGQVWNNYRGHGRIDALKAYQTLSEAKIAPGTTVNAQKGWTYQTMTKRYEVDTYQIEALKNERLVLTVTWNRAMSSSYTELSNINLVVSVNGPSGGTIFTETDSQNNLKKIDILLPEDGLYDVIIENTTDTRYRNYGMAFELLSPLTADFNTDYVVDDLDLVEFVPYWLDPDCNNPIQPCFPYNLSSNDSIDLSDYSIFAEKWLTYDGRYYSP
ncbi:MAG: S8 family peptidase [Planctomycetota bacterium]